MTITINNYLIVLCVFYFFLSAFLSYLFRNSNIFFKIIVFFFVVSTIAVIQQTNSIEVTISALLGFIFIYIDAVSNSLYGIKNFVENLFIGFFDMLRRICRFILEPIANSFTWFYNFLSRFFGWNLVFHPLGKKVNKQNYKSESSYRGNQSRKTRHNWKQKDENKDTKPDTNFKKSSRNPKPDQSSYEQHKQSSYKKNATNTSGMSPAERQKLEAINIAKEEVRRAREQAKRKNGQQDNSGGDRRTQQRILGLPDNFTQQELTRAYKMAVSRYHPDKYVHMSESFQNEAQAEFIKVKNAYNILTKEFE